MDIRKKIVDEFVEKTFKEKISIREAAKQAKLSSGTLSKHFSRDARPTDQTLLKMIRFIEWQSPHKL